MGTLALFNTLSVNYGVNSASGLFGKPVCRLDGFLQMQIFTSGTSGALICTLENSQL